MAGPRLFSVFFAGMPYAPFGRVVVWASILATIESAMTLSVLRAQGRALAYTALLLAPAVVRFGLTCFLLFVRHGGVLEVLLAHLYTSIVVLVPCLLVGLGQMRLSLRGEDVRRFAVFSGPILVHQLAAWGLNMVDRPLVNHFAGLAELGIYTFGYQVAMVLAMLSASLGSAWMPHFFSMAKKGHHEEQISRLATYVTGVTVLACLLVIACARPAVEILAPPAYGRAASIVPFIAVGYLLLGFGQLPRAALLFSGQTSVIAATTLVAVLLNIGLNWLTIRRFGITAAAVNTTLCFLVTAGLSIAGARKTGILRYEVGRLAKMAAVASGVGAAGSFLSFGSPGADLVLRPALCLVGFAGGLWLTSFFTAEERTLVGRGFTRMGQSLRRMVLKNA